MNAALVNWANIALIAGTLSPVSWQCFIWFLIPVIPFFFASWEEKYTGEFILPIVNGPNEGIFLCISLMLAQTVLGQAGVWGVTLSPHSSSHLAVRVALWAAVPLIDVGRWVESGLPIAGVTHLPHPPVIPTGPSPLSSYTRAWVEVATRGFTFPREAGAADSQAVISALVLTVGCFTALVQVVGVLRRVWRERGLGGAVYAASICAPFFLIIYGLAAWLFTPGLPRDLTGASGPVGWIAVYGTAGVFFVEAVVRIMLSFVCGGDDSFLPGPWFIVGRVGVFAALPALLSARGEALAAALGGVGLPYGGRQLLENALLAGALVNGSTFATFLHSATTQCAGALGIDVFSIQKQLAAAAAAAASTKTNNAKKGEKGATGGAGALPSSPRPSSPSPSNSVNKKASRRRGGSKGRK